jgi:hypothetical protein
MVTQFLRQLNFEDVEVEKVMGDMWIVRARRGECHVSVVELSTRGWTQELIKAFTEPSDDLFVVSGGSVYEDNATWLTAVHDIYIKILRRAGFARTSSGFRVAAAPTCAARQLPWKELRD